MRNKIKVTFFIILVLSGCLACRSGRVIATEQVVSSDTTQVTKIERIPYLSVSQLDLPVGGDIDLPELGLKVTRVNENEAFVERSQTLIERSRTQVRTLAVKQKTVDKAKDKRITGSTVNSKVKDQSQTNSNNKAKKAGNLKTKANHKQVKRGFQWWLLLLFIPLYFFGRYLLKRFSR